MDVLKEFYDRNKHKARVCENCGKKLIGHVCELAHILPKTLFKSVATEDDNLIFLCCGFLSGSNCHDEYDSTWTKAKTMPVWKIAIARFKLIEPKITETKYKKTLNHFYEFIERDSETSE